MSSPQQQQQQQQRPKASDECEVSSPKAQIQDSDPLVKGPFQVTSEAKVILLDIEGTTTSISFVKVKYMLHLIYVSLSSIRLERIHWLRN